MDTLDAANNDAAKQAIKYMEKTEKKIMKNYKYDQLIEKTDWSESYWPSYW